MAASRTACCNSSMLRNTVKIGRAELPSAAPSSRAVSASAPRRATSSSAASTISSLVNFGFGGTGRPPFQRLHIFLIIGIHPPVVKHAALDRHPSYPLQLGDKPSHERKSYI